MQARAREPKLRNRFSVKKEVARNKNSFNFMTKTKHKLGERESEREKERAELSKNFKKRAKKCALTQNFFDVEVLKQWKII